MDTKEKIADTYRSFSFWQDKRRRSVSEFEAKFDECATKTVALIKEAGWVKLSSDQSLPNLDPIFRDTHPKDYEAIKYGYSEAQDDMLYAGFRKVVIDGQD